MGIDVELNVKKQERDAALDIEKGILIVLMMIGHMEIPQYMRSVIYSFHMAAFIFYSGYCFKPKSCKCIKMSIRNIARTFLFPYLIWAFFYLIMNNREIVLKLLDILCGMTKSNKILTECEAVGQVYFLLLLFLVRLIYIFINKYIKKDSVQTVVVILLSMFGVLLSRNGYWLPWCLDCSLFTLVFYHVGYLVKKYEIIPFVRSNKLCYVLLAVFWGLAIRSGGMSLYIREYGNYLITVSGAVSASILVYIGCCTLSFHLPQKILNVLVDIGKNTLSILLLHTIFGGYIAIFIVKIFIKIGLGHFLVPMYIIVILLQMVLGLLWGRIYEKVCKTLF